VEEGRGQKRPKFLRLGEASGGVGGGAADNDTLLGDRAPAFTVTRGELAGLVRQAVESALGERRAQPVLLDREALALSLGCSSSMVDKMRRQGMPCVRLGESPRFELEACLSWLRKDGAA
jgi:hypothetical protein